MTIGIFDSGVGGLTVLKSLLKNYPNHKYIYYGDNLNVPYGNKSIEELQKYGNNIIEFLEKAGAEKIIIACGTLSSNKEILKSNVELIDLLSPLKNKLDNYHKISIMATPLSVKTNAFAKYINCNLNLIACEKLVPLIEHNDYTNLDEILKEYLQSTKDSDALILGCTHYPIIMDRVAKFFPKKIITLDEFILDKVKNLESSEPSLQIYFSLIDNNVLDNTKKILNNDKINIERKILNVRK